jgi:hypothetical protein
MTMTGILYIEAAKVEATSGQMLVTLTSGGVDFCFHLPASVAIKFRHKIMTDGWQVCCAPDAEVVPIRAMRRKGGQL